MRANRSLYDEDFYAWSNRQAALLRAGKLSDADIGNIAEEIESMGRSEKRELINRLRVLMLHLLKWQFQPEKQSRSWRASIKVQRLDVADHLSDNPSLKALLDEAIVRAYHGAMADAMAETGLSERTFPVACPWTFSQLADDGYLPETD